MHTETIGRIAALGAITGMRSMSGPLALALGARSGVTALTATLAAGEMAADKTRIVGNRTDPLPLTGRAVIGAIIGGLVARRAREHVVFGAVVGAATAVAAAHLAYRLRTQLPVPNAVGGLLEDGFVLAATALYASSRRA